MTDNGRFNDEIDKSDQIVTTTVTEDTDNVRIKVRDSDSDSDSSENNDSNNSDDSDSNPVLGKMNENLAENNSDNGNKQISVESSDRDDTSPDFVGNIKII